MIPRLLGRASARLQRRSTLMAVGGSSLALALGVVLAPWLFPESAFRPVSRVLAAPVAVALFGLSAALLAASALRESATGERPERWLPARSPERAHYDEVRAAGVDVDEALDADPAETRDLGTLRRDARRHVREVAVAVIAADENCDREAAADRLTDGSWTDDPRAAAFLGGRELAPLRIRIRDWASGERFDRWASHAVAELEARSGRELRASGTLRTDDERPESDDRRATGERTENREYPESGDRHATAVPEGQR